MSYGYVEEGKEIVFKSELPKSFKNISGFNNMSDEKAKEHGWYVVDEVASDKNDWQKITSKIYEVDPDDVIRPVYVVEDVSLEDYKTRKISQLKSEIEQQTLEQFPIFKQLSASFGHYNATKINTIKNGTKAAIDLVDLKEAEILDATSYEEVEQVTW